MSDERRSEDGFNRRMLERAAEIGADRALAEMSGRTEAETVQWLKGKL